MLPKRFQPSWNSVYFFILALSFAWGTIGVNAWLRLERIHVATLTSQFPLPALDAGSATGYKGGLRTMILPRGTDGYHWIMAAQRMAAQKAWRERWSPDDNSPVGRPMHWSQPLLWWMVTLGLIASWQSGIPLGACIEQCAVWSTVPLHLAVVLVFPLLVRRALGWGAAGLLSLMLAVNYSFASLFFAGAPDHHGLVAAALVGCALFLGVALVDRESARWKWSMASGVCAGLALWISAASAVPALVLMQIGAILAVIAWESKPSSVWRVWGITSAVCSLVAYLIEYFPDWMQLRLEVNNPLYALEMLGASEVLHQLSRWRTSGRHSVNFITLGLSLLLVFALPLTIVFGGVEVFVVKDSFLWQLHKDYIHEFSSLPDWIAKQHSEALFVALTPSFLLGPLTLWLIRQKSLESQWKSALLIVAVSAAGMFVLGLIQVRWMNMAESLWIALLAITTAIFCGRGGFVQLGWPIRLVFVFCCALAVIQMPQRIVRDLIANRGFSASQLLVDDLNLVAIREMAYRLRASGGSKIPVVASAPTSTTWLMYFGGMKGLGTLYWENLEGLRSNAELYASDNEVQAREVVKTHGISHIVFLWVEPFVAEYPRLLCGLPPGDPITESFSYKLLDGLEIPNWARPIPMNMPAENSGAWALVYDVREVSRPVR
jgi:hypothetical protein